MSLTQEPLYTLLKDYFVCGYCDITGKDYAGSSGHHSTKSKAVNTTNGAGPRNLQLFIINKDGVVLTCMPGYWHTKDILTEMKLAYKLNGLYYDNKIASYQKAQLFKQYHLEHIKKHSKAMIARSHLQHFDCVYEARHNLEQSDIIMNKDLIDIKTNHFPIEAFKTTDVIMHERMAQRPFLNYYNFDTAQFVKYGKPIYDKHEDTLANDGSKMIGAFSNDKFNNKNNTVKNYKWAK